MEQLPQFVRGKLRVPSNSPHPDPNVLAAFAENALTTNERTFLLQHLAQCFDCRELLSLSLTASPATPQLVHSPASSWLRWPVLRWAAAGACVVIVGAAVTLHYQDHPASRFAVNESDQVAAPAAGAPAALPSLADKAVQPPKAEKTNENLAVAKSAPAAPRRDSAFRPMQKDSRLFERAETRNAPATENTIASAPAAPPQSAKKEAENKALGATSTGQVAPLQAQSSNSNETGDLVPGKAKQASEDSMAKVAPASAPAPMLAAAANLSQAVPPRWTLSDGNLQRSLDGGKTWAASMVGTANLRALSALGSEIWVGGTNGVLFHSSDSGNHWTQVKPQAAGQALTADIIGVEFTDSQHGKLTTSDKHTWSTSDAGQTWLTQ